MYKSKKFEMYDYGSAEKNTEHYGQVSVTVWKPKTLFKKDRNFGLHNTEKHANNTGKLSLLSLF